MGSTEPVTFYDHYPFGWDTPDVPEPIEKVVSPPLVDLIGNLEPGPPVLDPGCGPVRVLSVVARRGVKCVWLDRSRVSMSLAAKRCGSPGVVGDNLRLPFADACASSIAKPSMAARGGAR